MFVRLVEDHPVCHCVRVLLILTALLGSTAQASVPKTAEAGGGAPDAGPAIGNWPQWRGPLASGLAPLADPPTAWAEDKNVRWKVKLPGQGTSTPIEILAGGTLTLARFDSGPDWCIEAMHRSR